jgi:hypothetical protein
VSGALTVAGNRFEVFWRGDGTEAEPYAIHVRVWSEDQGFDVTYRLATMTAEDLGAALVFLAGFDSDAIEAAVRRGES